MSTKQVHGMLSALSLRLKGVYSKGVAGSLVLTCPIPFLGQISGSLAPRVLSSKRPRLRRIASGFPVGSLRNVGAGYASLVGQLHQLLGSIASFYRNSELPVHAGISPWSELHFKNNLDS